MGVGSGRRVLHDVRAGSWSGDKDLRSRREDSARFRAEKPDGYKRPLESAEITTEPGQTHTGQRLILREKERWKSGDLIILHRPKVRGWNFAAPDRFAARLRFPIENSRGECGPSSFFNVVIFDRSLTLTLSSFSVQLSFEASVPGSVPMNRYRNAPTLRGPSKASANTLCQKCLKRDM